MLAWYSSAIFQAIQTSIAKKAYIFVIFLGVGGGGEGGPDRSLLCMQIHAYTVPGILPLN